MGVPAYIRLARAHNPLVVGCALVLDEIPCPRSTPLPSDTGDSKAEREQKSENRPPKCEAPHVLSAKLKNNNQMVALCFENLRDTYGIG